MDLLTVNETARLLRVSPITIRRYIASGRLPAERVGRGIRLRREAVEDFVTPIMAQTNTRESDKPSPNLANDARHSDEKLVEIYSPSSPDESVWVHVDQLDEYLDQLVTEGDDPLRDIVGIGRSGSPTNIAEHKDEYIADAILASSANEEESDPDELLGKPFTMDDPLWNMFGIGQSDDPTEVAENKHEYLAEAYLADKG